MQLSRAVFSALCALAALGAGIVSAQVSRPNGTTATAGVDYAGPTLTGTTGSIGGGALLAGGCTSGTVAVTNATTTMAVAVTPNTYPGDGTIYYGYVSSAGTVTVKVCAVIALTPSSSTYNVRVVQ